MPGSFRRKLHNFSSPSRIVKKGSEFCVTHCPPVFHPEDRARILARRVERFPVTFLLCGSFIREAFFILHRFGSEEDSAKRRPRTEINEGKERDLPTEKPESWHFGPKKYKMADKMRFPRREVEFNEVDNACFGPKRPNNDGWHVAQELMGDATTRVTRALLLHCINAATNTNSWELDTSLEFENGRKPYTEAYTSS